MTDSEDIADLKKEVAALKEEVAALVAWRTRTPVLKRLEDDTDHSFNHRSRLAEKIIREGREAEYILWMREDIKYLQFGMDTFSGILERLQVDAREFTDQFKVMRDAFFSGIVTDTDAIKRIIGESDDTRDNPLDRRKR